MSKEVNIARDYSISINDYNPNAFCLIRLEIDDEGSPVDWTFLYCNEALAKLVGTTREELVGHRFFDVFTNGNRKWLNYYYKAAFEDQPVSFDEISDEIGLYLHIDAHPIGQPGLCTCTLYDIQKETHEKRQMREQKAIEHKKDATMREQLAIIDTLSKSFRNVFVADMNNGTAKVIRLADNYNVRAVRDVSGQVFSFDNVVKRWLKENVHPEDRERIAEIFNIDNLKKIFDKQDALVGTYRNIEDNVEHHYQYDFRQIGDTDNVVVGFRIIDKIIEEHQLQENKKRELEEAKLREEKEHAEVISSLSTLYSTIFRADVDTHEYDILISVPLMSEVAKASGNFDDVKGKVIESFMEPEFRDSMSAFLDFDTLAWRLKYVNSITADYKAPTGQWMQARFIVKRRDENNVVKEVLYVARDVTEEKRRDLKQQEALKNALAAAQQANRAKSTFLSSMSHDIRTPMNAIIGFTSLAQTHIDNKTQVQDYLTKINKSSKHLLSLINDILDMSRIESGTVKLDEKPVHLPDILNDLRTMIQGLVNSKNLNLYIDTQDVVNEDVISDKLRLNQVLLNIVSNAIKFTQPGGDIIIRLLEKPCSMKNYTCYELSVKDTGIGISKEFIGHVFDTFAREQSATVSGIHGTGLGLSIAKNIVEMMGGEIKAESEAGKGSIFTVTLNLRIANAPVKNEPIPALLEAIIKENKEKVYDHSGKRILLVEDNELNREIATALLEETGMTVDSVSDGDIAITAVNEAPAGKYDLVLMDIQMPKMDGYTATREIRTLTDSHKANIPIVAMTANAFEEDKQRAFKCGMNGHIIKPISIEAINKVLDEIFGQRSD